MAKRSGKNGPSKLGKSPQIPVSAKAEAAMNAIRPARYQRNKTDEYIVTVLATERVPQEVIAKALNRPWGISVETMLHHYRRELAVAKATLLVLAYARLLRDIGDGTPENPGSKGGTRAAIFVIERTGRQLEKLREDKITAERESGKIFVTLKLGEGPPNKLDREYAPSFSAHDGPTPPSRRST